MLLAPEPTFDAMPGLGALVAAGAALGLGFLNAWRPPLLTIRRDALIVQTIFGSRSIPIRAGQPVGEFLAHSTKGRGGETRTGPKTGNSSSSTPSTRPEP